MIVRDWLLSVLGNVLSMHALFVILACLARIYQNSGKSTAFSICF